MIKEGGMHEEWGWELMDGTAFARFSARTYETMI